MGCWQETCALSFTPIYAGDPCVMVVLDAEWTHKVRSHSSVLGSIGSNWQWRPFREFHRGTYNDYGWINELKDRNVGCLFFHARVWDWAVATKNPWMYQHHLDSGLEQVVNDRAISRLTGPLAKKDDESEADWLWKMGCLNYTPMFIDFQKVAAMAGYLRRDIFSALNFRGMQEGDLEDWQKNEFLHLQMDILADQQKDDEYEDENDLS